MTDCISRQAAIDALNEYFARIGKLKRRGLTEGEKAISLDTVGAIKTLPSAQPIRHGKWMRTEDECGDFLCWTCSECGEQYVMPHHRASYCPNCGAKMDGEEE